MQFALAWLSWKPQKLIVVGALSSRQRTYMERDFLRLSWVVCPLVRLSMMTQCLLLDQG